jgi:hypothetical protein
MVGSKEDWQRIHPTTAWQTMPTDLAKDDFEVATDLFYITVNKQLLVTITISYLLSPPRQIAQGTRRQL